MDWAKYLEPRDRDSPMVLPNGDLLQLTVSVGVAHVLHHTESMRELYMEADAALYNAKHAGRDRVGVPAEPPRSHPQLTTG